MRTPTSKQLALLRRIRDERIAFFRASVWKWSARGGTSVKAVHHFAPSDAHGKVIGPDLPFDAVKRLAARGWLVDETGDDGILLLSPAGLALLSSLPAAP